MGCVDHPSDRKKHSGNAALVGGIGILIVVSLGHRLFLPESIPLFHSLMLPLVVIGLIGFIDDMYSRLVSISTMVNISISIEKKPIYRKIFILLVNRFIYFDPSGKHIYVCGKSSW